MKPTSFDDQLAISDPGDVIIYHRGFHCLISEEKPKRNEQAQAAWNAMQRGDVILYQYRLAEFDIEYCAKVVK